jgi:hypothetical protein
MLRKCMYMRGDKVVAPVSFSLHHVPRNDCAFPFSGGVKFLCSDACFELTDCKCCLPVSCIYAEPCSCACHGLRNGERTPSNSSM